MCRWLLFVTLFFLVNAAKNGNTNKIVFTKDKESIIKCIEDNLLKDVSWDKNVEVASYVAKPMAERVFITKEYELNMLKKSASHLISYLRNSDKVETPFEKTLLTEDLKESLRRVVVICADEKESVSDADEDRIFFTETEESLSSRIKDNLFKVNGWDRDERDTTAIARAVANRISGKSWKLEELQASLGNFFRDIRWGLHQGLFPDENAHNIPMVFSEYTLEAVLRVLINLSSNESSENDVYDVLENLLDFILVDWPFKLSVMIGSQDYFDLLRKYAYDALRQLESALIYYQNGDTLRLSLREAWLKLIGCFKDADIDGFLYPIIRYTWKKPIPHAAGYSNVLSTENSRNSVLNDPYLPNSLLSVVLNDLFGALVTDTVGNFRSDIHRHYSQNGMTYYELHLENHINTFYRILFFHVELIRRSIFTVDAIPRDVRAILTDDNAYRDYLLNLRREGLIHGSLENSVVGNLMNSDRVHEEDLMMLHLVIPGTSGVSSTTASTTTTTTTTETTTQRYDEMKKDNSYKSSSGKCFRYKDRATGGRDNDGNGDSSGIPDKKPRVDTQRDIFPAEEASVLLKTLSFMMESPGWSKHGDLRRRR